MAIRKDIDDMLNSLKSSVPPQPEKPKTELPKLRRKTRFDNMSVDDLLTALSEPEKSSAPEVPEVSTQPGPIQQTAPEPEPVVVHEPDPVPEPVPEPEPEPPVIPEPLSIPDPDPEPVFQFVQEEEPVPEKAPEERHRVVINEELPDYEAIRQAQLEMDRLERERAAAAASFAAAKEHEHTASAVDELQQFSARIAAENAADRVAEDAAAALEQLSNFSAGKQKKGFFSHFINRDDWETPYVEPENNNAPEQQYIQQPVYQQPVMTQPQMQQPVYQQPMMAQPQMQQPVAQPMQNGMTDTAFIEGIPVVGDGQNVQNTAAPLKESMPEEEQTVADTGYSSFPEPEYIPAPEEFAGSAPATDYSEAAPENGVTTFYEEIVVGGQPGENADPQPYSSEIHSPSVDELMDAAIAAVNEEIAAEHESDYAADEEADQAVDSMIAGIREDAASAIADMDIQPVQEDEAFSYKEEPQPIQTEAEPEPQPEPETVKPKGKVTSTLENILSEDPEDIINARSEKIEEDGLFSRDRSGAKKVLYTVLGVVFALLACVGLVTVIGKGAGLVSRFASGESQKDKFAKAVYPAVIMDISDFEQPSELTSDQVITAAIWSMIMTDGALDKYERNFDVVTIPAVDVEAAAVNLFGDGLTELTHGNVGTGDAKFYYSEEKKSYNVQIHPIVYTYSPDIKSVTKNGNEYTVAVDYINELPSWLERTSTKSVVFKLVETNGSYQIRSMKVTSAKLSI